MTSFIKIWRTKAISMYGKARGLSKDQRAKVTAAAHGKKVTKSKSSNPRPKKKARKVKRKMAKRKRRRSRKLTIPLAPLVGLAPMLGRTVSNVMAGASVEVIVDNLVYDTLGYSMGAKVFDPAKLIANVTPLIAGLLIHKFVGGAPLNLNRTLAAAGVPFIRI